MPISIRETTSQMQCTEGKRCSCTGYLQIQAVQCLFRSQHVHAAENRFLPGGFFKEYLLQVPERSEDQPASFYDPLIQECCRYC